MILNITKPQYRRLVELLAIAEMEIESFAEHGLLEASEKRDYDQILNTFFKHSSKMNCDDVVEFDQEDQSWNVSEALFEYWFDKKYALEKENFKQELATRMAAKTFSLIEQEMDEEESIKAYAALAEQNYQLIRKNGLGLLEWIDKKALKKRYPDIELEEFLHLQAKVLSAEESEFLYEQLDQIEADVNDSLASSALQAQSKAASIDNIPQNVLRFPDSAKKPSSTPSKDVLAYQLKISLVGAKPPVWRRIEVPSHLNLLQLHQIIQGIFTLFDMHLHAFLDAHGEIDETMEENLTLSELLTFEGHHCGYVYDFGDNWEFKIELEKSHRSDANRFADSKAFCLAGKRSGPIEDIGGTSVLNDLAKRIKEGKTAPAFYEEFFGDNEPKLCLEYFDKQQTNIDLQTLTSRWI